MKDAWYGPRLRPGEARARATRRACSGAAQLLERELARFLDQAAGGGDEAAGGTDQGGLITMTSGASAVAKPGGSLPE